MVILDQSRFNKIDQKEKKVIPKNTCQIVFFSTNFRNIFETDKIKTSEII